MPAKRSGTSHAIGSENGLSQSAKGWSRLSALRTKKPQPMSEIVIHRQDAGNLPRRRRGSAEPTDTRLLRTIAASPPSDSPPVSQLEVETALEAMADATKAAIAADLDCYIDWSRRDQRPPLPEIGRAVQQECRDRSRMPSSA
eukprot:TRINITY_DN12563_c0_g1_i49.p2 TRINITY_DN12563_c0_g1~~TRINITY_DN12563_c0_g1_i49.p2  ORF type:complete len:143 (+),score=18.93 TRINITY_DN12563_c0_g1_i49:212-640(+)